MTDAQPSHQQVLRPLDGPGGPGGPVPVATADAIVVGSGVAGCSVALDLAPRLGRCLLITAGPLGRGGSSPLAQGGIAAAIGPGDGPVAHAGDTVAVSAGLGDQALARLVTAGGPEAVETLIERGAVFDLDPGGGLALGREAGHSARRIVHANGDATGAEVMRALAAAVTASPSIEVRERSVVVDLVRRRGRVVGVVTERFDGGQEVVLAPAVVLATGGYGHCFARTTNPPSADGSGIAAAARAGASVADMEMVQFHPTALDVDGVARLPLLTEALRGEGAVLVDERGRRFMADLHPDAELAPRDVVARAIYRQVVDGHRPYLDGRAAIGTEFGDRFPTVFALARANGFDPRTEPLPVTPAAHYTMGGVAVDDRGRTTVPGLWAVGEVASTGLHGANRLASNSLLEGLVLGRRVALDVVGAARATPPSPPKGSGDVEVPIGALVAASPAPGPGRPPLASAVRQLLWASAGVERRGDDLDRADRELAVIRRRTEETRDRRAAAMATVAALVVGAALARTESRGAHHRIDHPMVDERQARRRIEQPSPARTQRWRPTVVAGAPAAS